MSAPIPPATPSDGWIAPDFLDRLIANTDGCEGCIVDINGPHGMEILTHGELNLILRLAKKASNPPSETEERMDLPGTIRLAVWFHDTYEKLAPQYGYETRPESRTFDASTPNGRLMIAVCRELRETFARSATEGPTREQVEALRFAGKYFEGFGFSHIQHGHSWTGAGLSEALQMLEQRLLRQATPVSPDGLDETDRRINARITLEDRASGKDNAAERGT